MNFRPTLGVAIQLSDIQYPTIASRKLDGIRCLGRHGQLLSRTLKLIPNRHIQNVMSRQDGWDGELIVGDPTHKDVYRNTVSAVMSQDGQPEPHWHIFDDFTDEQEAFINRVKRLPDDGHYNAIIKVPQQVIFTQEELLLYEDKMVGLGYEGLILRAPGGQYKRGRSTVREQIMLKLKRFVDDEAKVVDFEELMHNANAAQIDERGYTKRSSHQDNKVPTNTLGALVVEWRGHHLRLGTGFTAADRDSIWRERETLYGRMAKFKYLPVGMKDLPRHPVWLGWRSELDV